MKVKVSPQQVHLSRVLNGWYSYLSADAKVSYTVIRHGKNLWEMTNDLNGNVYDVPSLDKVREIIAQELGQS